MRNRAKCKLCESIIESFHRHDYVMCKCGHIAVDGGQDYFRAMAINWDNFMRMDDVGNEIIVTVKEPEEEQLSQEMPTQSSMPSKKDMLEMLDGMIKSIEKLPSHAMTNPINHYDFSSLMILLVAILRSDCKDEI